MSRHVARGANTRGQGVDPHESGALESWGGVVSGHVTDYAEALGCAPECVLRAAEEIDLLFDTAETRGSSRSDDDRATDPGLRCLGMTEPSFETLRELTGDI